MNDKINLFLRNAELIADEFATIPLLYGSLGLECLTGASLNTDDIDILIPRQLITEEWLEFKDFLESVGYTLTDENEHTFTKDGVEYSYADIEDLESFASIAVSDIEIREAGGVRFMLLSLEQYLRVYSKSMEDGYRVNIRQKKDGDKIKFIESKLS